MNVSQVEWAPSVWRGPKGRGQYGKVLGGGGVWFLNSNNALYIALGIFAKGLREGAFQAYDKTNWLAHRYTFQLKQPGANW